MGTPLQKYYSEIKGPDGRYCQQAVCTMRSLSRIHPMCMSSILAVHPNRKLLSRRFEGLKSLAPPLGVMVCEKFCSCRLPGLWGRHVPVLSLNFPGKGLASFVALPSIRISSAVVRVPLR